MKTILLIEIVAMLFLSCCKKDETVHADSIMAGQVSGNGILYTNVVPDDTISGFSDTEDKTLDLNQDGIDDILLRSGHITAAGFGNGGSWAIPLGENEIARPFEPGSMVDTLSYGETIDKNLVWGKGTSELYYYYYDQFWTNYGESGLWRYGKLNYIGIRIYKDDKILYGWIRVEISVVGSQKLMEYAVTTG